MKQNQFPTAEALVSLVNELQAKRLVLVPNNAISAFIEACRDLHVGRPSGGAMVNNDAQFFYL